MSCDRKPGEGTTNLCKPYAGVMHLITFGIIDNAMSIWQGMYFMDRKDRIYAPNQSCTQKGSPTSDEQSAQVELRLC